MGRFGALRGFALLLMVCCVHAACPVHRVAAQVAGESKPGTEAKTLRLPGPGERVLLRVPARLAGATVQDAEPLAQASAWPPPGAAAPDGAQSVPPPNNNCANAQFIAGIGDFPFDNTNATTDGQAHFQCNFFGQSQIANDVWFRWRAPATAQFVADTCTGTFIDTKIAVYTLASCPPNEAFLLGCNDDACSVQSRVIFNATMNQDYLVRVGVYPGQSGGPGTLRFSYQAGQVICTYPPSNCQARDLSNAFESTALVVKDDFTPTSSGVVNGLCFWGTYFNGLTNCQGAFPDRFRISYYDDFFGTPDLSPFASFAIGQYTLTGPVPTGNMINGIFPEYAYRITHPGVQIFANDCYWVEIRNELPPPPDGNCSWYWLKGQGGNGVAYQGFDRIADDMAFCLNLALDPATECQDPSPPVNDSCAGALIVSCNNIRFDQDNLFATTNPSDPPFSCRFGSPGQGVGTMWYRFTPSQTSARISLCDNRAGDTLMALYSGTCGNLTEIACNDDFCGVLSQMTVTGLTPGQTYYLQVASWSDETRGIHDITVACPAPPPPANDTCAGAVQVSIPSNTNFNTISATPDTGAPMCGFSLISGPGVWYRVTGDGSRITADLCNPPSNYDTKVSIFCGSCPSLTCVAENDDDCGVQSRISWCSEAGRTYYILVHGFSGQIGQFSLLVFSDGQPCSGSAECDVCVLTCPTGSVPEGEPCGSFQNDGCNLNPPQFGSIECGQTVCGTMFTSSIIRDTDWYQFTINTPSIVSWSVQSEAPVQVFLLSAQCPPAILFEGETDRCGTAVATGLLPAGTYRAFVGAVGDAYPCGNSNTYIGTLQCGALGACCIEDDCRRVPQSECATLKGVYAGDASVCPISYPVAACAEPFEDIEATGTRVLLTGDSGASVPIGFQFRFYGVEYTIIGVSSNGYLSFDPQLAVPANAPIPSTSPPNALIAPLWDDFAPENGGRIHVQTLGQAPNRRFIAQWKDVPQFLMTDANTFQAVLFEGTNCVEFRYAQVTPENPPGDYTVGVENQSGADGAAIPGSSILNGSCFRLCPQVSPGGCENIAPCPGDANGDRVVNFQDITAALNFWGQAGPIGDANGDGLVDFQDITAVLLNWGAVCPIGQ